ncbi:MAG TPA: DUF3592 domain-containing protein [Pyrinomonadaceae bacterium]
MTDRPAVRMSRDSRRPYWSPLIIAAPWVIGLTFCLYGWYWDRRVALREQTTLGTITAHEPANHDRYGYTFKLNEKTYSGWQVPQDSEEFAVGQVVTVHYDPLDPKNNALVDFNELSWRAFGPVPFLAAAIASVVLFVLERRRALRNPTGPSST